MRTITSRKLHHSAPDPSWQETEKMLRQEKRRIAAAIINNQHSTNDMNDGWQERDSPSEDEIREVEFHHRETLRATLRRIDDALQRLVNHTYGRCVDCRRKIGVKRLQRDPATARCLACQNIVEGDLHTPSL